MDDRELDARLTKLEQGINFLVQKEIEYEKEEEMEEEDNELEEPKIKRKEEDE